LASIVCLTFVDWSHRSHVHSSWERSVEAQDLLGEWWIPGQSSEPFEGTLHCSESGVLTLERASVTPEVWKKHVENPSMVFPLICGHTEWGKSISLLHAVQNGRVYGVWQALVGVTLSTSEDKAFSSVTLQPRGLLGWLGESGLANDTSRNDGRTRVAITYDQPAEVIVAVDDASVRFVNTYSMHVSRARGEIREVAQVILSRESPLSHEEWLESYVKPMMAFFSFVTGVALTTETLDLRSPLVMMELPGGRRVQAPIAVLFRKPAEDPDPRDPHIFPDALFTALEVSDGLESIVQRWFGLHRDMTLALDLLLANRRPAGLRVNGRFMNAVSALEIAHRTLYRSQMESPSQHRARVDAIIGAVPVEYRRWLRGRLQFSNEPSLSVRLHELLDDHEPYLEAAIGDPQKFTTSVVSTRNYFVHGTGRKNVMADDIGWLRRATTLLEMLLECSILERMQPAQMDLRANVSNTLRFLELSKNPL